MNEMKVNEKLVAKELKELYKKSGKEFINENSTAFVYLRDVNKIYPNGVQAVYDFNLEIDKHDFVALVGPSGCGKSTTLRMIAGIEDISSGYLYIDKVLSNYLPSKDRDIAMVFQSYALYPQMTVYENIAFGLEIRKIPKKEIEKRVFAAAKILDLGHYLDRRPKELSGGQMQRVALGRAIVRNAQLFLMDEPLSNLDAKLRVMMRSELVRIHEEVGATTIYVTHDQIEAMTMANKIVVMNKGFIQQIGKPMEIYENPANLFVATFIGSPSMNIINATYYKDAIKFEDGFSIHLPSSFSQIHDEYYHKKIIQCEEILQKIDVLGKEEMMKIQSSQVFSKNDAVVEEEITYTKKKNLFTKFSELFKKKIKVVRVANDEKEDFKNEIISYLETYKLCLNQEHKIKFGIRPEHIVLATKGFIENNSTPFTIKTNIVEILGSEFIIHGDFNGTHLTAKLDSSTYVKSHSTVQLVLDVSKVHLFDLISGERIK